MKVLDSQIYLERLETLAFTLMYNSLHHKRFDISMYSNHAPDHCDSRGCALGECPSLFPKDWEWSDYYDGDKKLPSFPTLKEYHNLRAWECAKIYFGISLIEAYHLFRSDSQYPNVFGGKHISFDATRDDVANNIRDFIKKNNTPIKRFLNNVKALFKLRVNVCRRQELPFRSHRTSF
jgi:hypothetical protein